MARLTCATTGNTTGSVFEPSLINPTLSATNAAVTTTGIFSNTFTAPNTTNKETGTWFYVFTVPATGRDFVVTLQQSTVDTAATVTIPVANLHVGWNYARLTTPYQYTTTSANAYRWKIRTLIANSGSVALTGGAGTPVCMINSYDALTTLGANDNLWIAGGHNGTGTNSIKLTVNGTGNVNGSGDDKAVSTSTPRTLGAGIVIADGGELEWDKASNATLQTRGTVILESGGTYDKDGNVSDRTIKARHIMDCETANGNYIIITRPGSIRHARSGDLPTNYVEYVSGAGTGASPLVVDRTTNWKVGDEIVLEGNAYNELEKRFIRTVVSPTQFTLSNTSGGAEAGLTYTHTAGSTIGNFTRNSIMQAQNSTRGYYIQNLITNLGDFDMTGERHEYASHASGHGLNVAGAQTIGIADYVALYGGVSNRTGLSYSANKTPITVTGVLAYLSPSTNISNGFIYTSGSANINFVDCMTFGSEGNGMCLSRTYNCEITNYRAIASNTSNNGNGGGLYITDSGTLTFNSCRINSSRRRGLWALGMSNVVFNDCNFANIGSNEIDIDCGNDSANDIVFNNSTLESPIIINNYQNMLEGSRIGFHRLQDTDRNHAAYQPNVVIESSGSGLVDTIADTTYDADSLAMKLTPVNATTYGTYNFDIPQRRNSKVTYFAKIRKTSDFNGDVILELYLNGELTPASTYTFSGTDSIFIPTDVLEANSTSSTEDLVATLRLKVRGTVGSIYLDTAYDASRTTNPIASMDIWKDGVPNPFIVSTVASSTEIAAAVQEALQGNLDEILSNTDATQAKVDQL